MQFNFRFNVWFIKNMKVEFWVWLSITDRQSSNGIKKLIRIKIEINNQFSHIQHLQPTHLNLKIQTQRSFVISYSSNIQITKPICSSSRYRYLLTLRNQLSQPRTSTPNVWNRFFQLDFDFESDEHNLICAFDSRLDTRSWTSNQHRHLDSTSNHKLLRTNQ